LHSEAGLTDEASMKVYDHYNTGALGLKNYKGDKEFCMAWTLYKSGKRSISVKNSDMKLHKFSDHSNEISNIFVHEYGHEGDFRSLGVKEYDAIGINEQERRATNIQIDHSTFDKTRSYFRGVVFDYLKQHSKKQDSN